MVAGLTYSQYVSQLALLAVVAPDDPNYVANLPSAIDWAELSIYRDLDLLSTVSSLSSLSLTAYNRTFVIPANLNLVTLQQINIITPVSTSDPNTGTRNPCLPTTKERLDFEWSSSSGASLPKLFAPFNQTQTNQTTVLFGPWPDQAYSVEIVGTVRPASLSAIANPTTWISMNVPDLFLAASMIQISGYQRNWGRQADDSQMAVSWQQQYDKHLATAVVEENRKKFAGPGWTSMSPTPVASPTRG